MITNEEYHADKTHISCSGTGLIHQAPAKYYAAHLDPKRKPRKDSKVFDFGSAGHKIILEQNEFDKEFIVSPNFTGEGSKFRKDMFAAANKDKTVVSINTLEDIQGMRKSIYAHPIASELLKNGVAEQSYTWIDPITGAKCKCRPDWWNEKLKYIVDIKTTVDASDDGFQYSAKKFRYHVQSPFYFDGMEANMMHPKRFVFIAVEKDPPYCVNVFHYESHEMEHGREIYREDLETYQKCLESDKWPGYSEDIKVLEIPGLF